MPREAQLKILLARDPASPPERPPPRGGPQLGPAFGGAPPGPATARQPLGPAFTGGGQAGRSPLLGPPPAAAAAGGGRPPPPPGRPVPVSGAAPARGPLGPAFAPGQPGARPVSPLKGRPPFPSPAAAPKAAAPAPPAGGKLAELLKKLTTGQGGILSGAALGASGGGGLAGGAAGAALGAAGPVGLAVMAAKRVADEVGAAVKEAMPAMGAAAGGAAGGPGLAAAGVGLNALKKVPGVGKAIGAVETGMDFLAARSRQVARNIGHLGTVVEAVARDDLAGAQLATIRKRQQELEAIPVLGKIVNWWEENAERAAAVQTKIQATAALGAKAAEFARFSPAAARAQAQADLIGLQTQITKARQAGPEAGRFLRAQAVHDSAIARMLTQHQERWMSQLARLYEEGRGDSQQALELTQKMLDGNAELSRQLQEDSKKGAQLREELQKTMQAIRRDFEEGKGSSTEFIDKFLEGLQARPFEERPLDEAAEFQMNAPLPLPGNGGFGFGGGGF